MSRCISFGGCEVSGESYVARNMSCWVCEVQLLSFMPDLHRAEFLLSGLIHIRQDGSHPCKALIIYDTSIAITGV